MSGFGLFAPNERVLGQSRQLRGPTALRATTRGDQRCINIFFLLRILRQMNILLLVDTTIEGASPSHARQEL